MTGVTEGLSCELVAETRNSDLRMGKRWLYNHLLPRSSVVAGVKESNGPWNDMEKLARVLACRLCPLANRNSRGSVTSHCFHGDSVGSLRESCSARPLVFTTNCLLILRGFCQHTCEFSSSRVRDPYSTTTLFYPDARYQETYITRASRSKMHEARETSSRGYPSLFMACKGESSGLNRTDTARALLVRPDGLKGKNKNGINLRIHPFKANRDNVSLWREQLIVITPTATLTED